MVIIYAPRGHNTREIKTKPTKEVITNGTGNKSIRRHRCISAEFLSMDVYLSGRVMERSKRIR
jgi:hypothetical protein